MGLAEVWYDRRWPRQGLTSRCATEKHPLGQPRRRGNRAASRQASPSPQPRPPPRTDHPPTPAPAPRGPCPSATLPLTAYPASTRRMRTGHAGFGGVLTVGIVTIARNLQFIPEKWWAGFKNGCPSSSRTSAHLPPMTPSVGSIWLKIRGLIASNDIKKPITRCSSLPITERPCNHAPTLAPGTTRPQPGDATPAMPVPPGAKPPDRPGQRLGATAQACKHDVFGRRPPDDSSASTLRGSKTPGRTATV